jgi:uncharacterized protein (DUF2225 family)
MFDEVNKVEKSKGYDVYKAIKYWQFAILYDNIIECEKLFSTTIHHLNFIFFRRVTLWDIA